MKNQARTMAAYYKKTATERRDWQEGNFIDEEPNLPAPYPNIAFFPCFPAGIMVVCREGVAA